MNNALLIARRELRFYSGSMLGYIVVAVTLALIGALWILRAFSGPPRLSADVLGIFFGGSGGDIFAGFGANGFIGLAVLVLAIRQLAGERERGTIVLLNTAPIKDREIVLGKYLAGLALVLIMTLLTVYIPVLIAMNGKITLGHVLVGYAGVVLYASSALAIGLFASSLAPNQVLALVIGLPTLLVLNIIWFAARVTDPPIKDFISAISLYQHQGLFTKGVLRLENVVYYVGDTYLFLLAATKTLEARRWR